MHDPNINCVLGKFEVRDHENKIDMWPSLPEPLIKYWKTLSTWALAQIREKDLWILVKELPTLALSLASWSKGLVRVAWTIRTTKYQPISRRGINAHRRPPTRAFTREENEASTEGRSSHWKGCWMRRVSESTEVTGAKLYRRGIYTSWGTERIHVGKTKTFGF